MNARLSNMLSAYAQRYNPTLLHQIPVGADRIRFLANGLLGSGLMFLLAEIPANNYNLVMQTWHGSYSNLYGALASRIYGATTPPDLRVVDALPPPLLVLEGQLVPVIQVLGGYIMPYVFLRQSVNSISDPELLGLLTVMLDDMEASDIQRHQRDELWGVMREHIGHLLMLPVRHYCLTTMKQPLFQQPSMPPPFPDDTPVPEPPRSTAPAPNTGSDGGHAKSEETHDIPFNPNAQSWARNESPKNNNGRVPPVPPLPDK